MSVRDFCRAAPFVVCRFCRADQSYLLCLTRTPHHLLILLPLRL
jgi:hypothetical protein